MSKRKKIEKGIESLKKQIVKHEEKIAQGAKEETISYWESEIERFEREIKRRKERLSK